MSNDDHWAATKDVYRVMSADDADRLGEPDGLQWIDDLTDMHVGVIFAIAVVTVGAMLWLAAIGLAQVFMWAGWW